MLPCWHSVQRALLTIILVETPTTSSRLANGDLNAVIRSSPYTMMLENIRRLTLHYPIGIHYGSTVGGFVRGLILNADNAIVWLLDIIPQRTFTKRVSSCIVIIEQSQSR